MVVLSVALAEVESVRDKLVLSNTLAMVLTFAGRALESYALCLEIHPFIEAHKDDYLRGQFYSAYAHTLAELRQLDDAAIAYAGASHYFELIGHERHIAATQNNWADLLVRMNKPAEAHEHLDSAFRFYQSIQDYSALGQVSETRARAFLAQGNTISALHSINQSIDFLSGDEKGLQAESYRTKGRILARLRQLKESAHAYNRAIDLTNETDSDASAIYEEALRELLQLAGQREVTNGDARTAPPNGATGTS